jgi:capsular exopolysaccharide synthesis family protein
MSRIYDALKKLEAERSGGASHNGHGTNGHNGHGNGNGNGHGNGHGRRWGFNWQRFFRGGSRAGVGATRLSFDLGPEVEEAFQRLSTGLLVGPGVDLTNGPRVLGVTSSQHGEGTTTTAGVLGSILVRRRGGRVVVVEANYRSPSFDVAFGVVRNGGFAELVEGRKSLAEVAQVTSVPDLMAVTCGHSVLAPSALFDAPGMSTALEKLREEFAFVILDLPPVNVYSDTSIVGPRLDAAVLVIEADRTRLPDVERSRRTLDRVGAKVVGSVLNRRRDYIPPFLEELL